MKNYDKNSLYTMYLDANNFYSWTVSVITS